MNKSSHDPENGDLIYVLSRQLTAEYGRSFSFMANPVHGVSAFIRVHLRYFINFHPQLIDLKQIKKKGWRMAF